MSKFTPEQWAEARRRRGQGASFAAIGAGLGISSSVVRRRAQREGWADVAPQSDAVDPKRKASARGSQGTRATRAKLVRRLYNVLELRTRIMELRMQKQLDALEQGNDLPPGTDDSAVFGVLIKNIDQVTEFDTDTHPAARGGDQSAAAQAAASEADAFRREIADRIEKLTGSA